ncbi:MAG: aminotransferase class IV [Candidatus Muiribacteriota bacterium]
MDYVFETILTINTEPVFLNEHIKRLCGAANYYNFEISDFNYIYEKTAEFLEGIKNTEFKKNRLNIFLFNNGKLEFLLNGVKTTNTQKLIFLETIKRKSNKKYYKNDLIRLDYFEAFQYYKKNISDFILLNEKGNIAECIASNIFFVKDDESIYTPPDNAGIVKGIIREKVIELSSKQGIPVFFENIKPVDVKDFNNCFITNSLKGIKNITKIEALQFKSKSRIIHKLKNLFDFL